MGHYIRTVCVICVIFSGCMLLSDKAHTDEFPPETDYDTTVYPDEALVNVRIRNNRWPDCYRLDTAVQDMFRIEGVDDTPDATEAKAFALWRWFNTLMSTRGSRVFEGRPFGKRRDCRHGRKVDYTKHQVEIRRGDKLLLVYGMHECGGNSRTLVHMWRSVGFLGYQEASRGHSTAAFRYPDKDGIWRMHSFNPQGHSYYWNPRDNRVGARRRPVMRGVEYKRFLPPMQHTLRRSLRLGEIVELKWDNEGYIQKTSYMLKWAKEVGNFKRHLGAAVVGQEDQVLSAVTNPGTFKKQLWKDSQNTACSAPAEGKAVLHPEKAGEPAHFIYRLASPYVAIESEIEAGLVKTAPADTCRLYFSTDMGKSWHMLYDHKETGLKKVELNLGRKQYWDKKPSITAYYTFLIKAEFRTDSRPEQVGMNALKVTVHRQGNKRAMCNLMPGENIIKISADAIPEDTALKLQINYEVNGEKKNITRNIVSFPHYFRVDIKGLPQDKLKNPYYLAKFGGSGSFNLPEHPLRMHSVKAELVPRSSADADESMSAKEAEPFFKKAYPIPYTWDRKMVHKDKIPEYESEVSGFFPQFPRTDDQPKDPVAYYNWLADHIGRADPPLIKIKDDSVKDAVAWCIEKFPKVHSLHKLGLCNALAHFRDKRAIPVLLEYWKKAPASGPGDRYIPDTLAAIGDPSVVPALVAEVKRLRYDYRVHVAHALGILGGKEAVKALESFAENDPNISVRSEAERNLKKLKSGN